MGDDQMAPDRGPARCRVARDAREGERRAHLAIAGVEGDGATVRANSGQRRIQTR